MRINNIGVLTGGGDCPGLNAVIRAVAKTAIVKHKWRVFGIKDGFDGLIRPNKIEPLTLESIRGIIAKGGTILGTSNSVNPFAYKHRVNGKTRIDDYSRKVIKKVNDLGLNALIIIGGDGTLSIASKLCEMGVPLVGVPKTIDNDLCATEVTFGFDTAINTATEAIDKLHTTAESHHRVIVVEVMGRNSGWIALVSGVAGGADVILIPEIPFEINSMCKKIVERSRTGRPFSLVVVAEGAVPLEGKPIYQEKKGPGGFPRLGGIGTAVGKMIGETIDMEVRVTVLGHLQRGGSPTPHDRLLATRFGVAAVDALKKGNSGAMVCLQCGQITSVPIKEAIHRQKLVDPEGELVRTARSLGISFGN